MVRYARLADQIRDALNAEWKRNYKDFGDVKSPKRDWVESPEWRNFWKFRRYSMEQQAKMACEMVEKLEPEHATMGEYKHYAPANHFHLTWNLKTARLQYWMDLANVLSITPWQEKPAFREGIDRPLPLLYLLNGGENAAKMLRKRT